MTFELSRIQRAFASATGAILFATLFVAAAVAPIDSVLAATVF